MASVRSRPPGPPAVPGVLNPFPDFTSLGTTRLGDRTKVKDQCWPAQLEQGVHQGEGAAEGQGDCLLLWEPHLGESAQAEMQ